MCKKTTTNANRSSTSSKADSSAGQSKAETLISTRTDNTSTEFGKIFKNLEELDKKLEKTMNEKNGTDKNYGGKFSDHGVSAVSHHGEGCENAPPRSTLVTA